jgi:hypothetical protein
MIRIMATPADIDQKIGITDVFDFREVCDGLSEIINAIGEKLESAKAKKTVVEFGLEVGVEAGHLTALIAKGSATANLKITLEWS